MSKIEDVARVLREAVRNTPDGKSIPFEEMSFVLARAAIKAMREPTPEMIAATLPYFDQPDDDETTRLAERAVFLLEGPDFPAQGHRDGLHSAKDLIRDHRSMIDAALREEGRIDAPAVAKAT